MLKYSIKLGNESIKEEELVWREKYLSPDLSFVSGVTSQDYHIERFDKLHVSSNTNVNPNGSLPLEVENVKRQGFVVIRGKEYKIGKNEKCEYVFINGTYYYAVGTDKKFIIDDILAYDNDKVVTSSITIDYPFIANSIKIDTIAWIEDGVVNIDGVDYLYDFELNKLRSVEYGNEIVESSSITKCTRIDCYPYYSPAMYENISKFKLYSNGSVNEEFNEITFVDNFYYVNYKDEYFTIYLSDNKFYCDIPSYLLYGGSRDEEYTAETFEVYYIDGDDEIRSSNATLIELTGDSFSVFDEPIIPFVIIEDTRFYVQKETINTNGGNKIGVFLSDTMNGIMMGDVITFVNNADDYYRLKVYNNSFVVYNGKKYYVKANLCDKISLNGIEHDIVYNNGKKSNADCLVDFGGVYKTYKINANAASLITYGKIVTSTTTTDGVSTAVYPIIEYSGVTIGDKNYTVYKDENANEYYINFDKSKTYPFIVKEVIGSSLVVCTPNLSNTEFTDEFIKAYSEMVCNDVVGNELNYGLYVKDNIFGTHEITEDLGYLATSNPVSSKDYFNLFDNLHVYCDSSFIHLPINLSAPQGNNLLQDDLVKRDFFEAEKKKAINPIIDMEKDIYTPKFMDNKYSGSNTDFHSVDSIRINLHFRTRNLDNWKVNEDYNDSSFSGQNNWFVTDYYPYTSTDTDKVGLLNSSDLVGLMNFTNNDVYYQKSKITKSFLRFSYYDSVDPEEQTLLATSTVFMDGARLFKKFIDNSKKYYYFYKEAAESSGMSNSYNKISVKTEFCGKYGKNKTCSKISIDDEHRIGSEFIISNKHQTQSSAEGYYLHIFKEYSENLKPKPIYMKIEFNHAGIGRTIPFIIPMHWEAPTGGTSNYKYPIRRLTLSNNNNNNNDLAELKKGVKLEDSYAQSYIPLYAVYDFKNKEYAYVFDNRYVDANENSITLNLFEIKYADDSKDTAGDDEIKDVTNGRQIVAKININEAFS